MSSIYIPHPTPTGKVIFHTSHGDIDINLFCKELPKTCRYFVHLCLKGYYNNTLVHHIIPDFMIQIGDRHRNNPSPIPVPQLPFPPFEQHSRIKFAHRGIVAFSFDNNDSNDINPNNNIFITFNKADWLNKHHSIIGVITGPTIYNFIKLNELVIEENAQHRYNGNDNSVNNDNRGGRPLHPPVINSVEVIDHPFTDLDLLMEEQSDIAPTSSIITTTINESINDNKKHISGKKIKDKKLLSFGDTEEEGGSHAGIQSSHDVLDDPRLLTSNNRQSRFGDPTAAITPIIPSTTSNTNLVIETISQSQKRKIDDSRINSTETTGVDNAEKKLTAAQQRQLEIDKLKQEIYHLNQSKSSNHSKNVSYSNSNIEVESKIAVRPLNVNLPLENASVPTIDPTHNYVKRKDINLDKQKKEAIILEKLNNFKSSLHAASNSNQTGKDNWKTHYFNSKKNKRNNMDIDDENELEDNEDYVIIDPRLQGNSKTDSNRVQKWERGHVVD